jgi:hypothetical protein
MWHGERWRETKQAPNRLTNVIAQLLKVGRRREEKWKAT